MRLQIGSLKPLHISNCLDGETWNDTTKHNAVRAVIRAINWAIKEGRLKENPLKGVERPIPKRRETFVSKEQFNLLISQSNGCLKDYLTFLFETGARPQDIRVIEAQHVDSDAGRIVLTPSQAKAKQCQRVIYVTNCVKDK